MATEAMSASAKVAREIRAELGRQRISRAELARRLQVTPWLISRRMSGTTPFTVDEVHEIAHVLEVPAERLLQAS